MTKTLVMLLLLLQLTSFIAFAEELESLHTPTPLHPPAKSPHHYHHNPSPTPSRSHVHAPLHPPHHTKPPTHHHHQHPPAHSPVQPPTHHHHSPAHAPVHKHVPVHPPHHAKPPTHHRHQHPPAHSPIQPPTHHHQPPAHAPVHKHVLVHPPRHAKPPTHHNHQRHAPVQPPTHHHPPAHAPAHKHIPVHPPFHSHVPTKSPTPDHHHTPALAPAHTPLRSIYHPRSLITVQGVVYVKSCKHAGGDTLLGATSIIGAIVKLRCNNTKQNVVLKGKTDKNGYFYIKGSNNISSYAARKCNVVLVSAPNGLKPSNLHGGITGAVLKAKKSFVSEGHPFILYNVAPLAFQPKCSH